MQNKWIPCNKELPPDKGEYIVSLNNNKVTCAIYLPHCKKFVDTIEEYFEYSCKAWQYLPQPYK